MNDRRPRRMAFKLILGFCAIALGMGILLDNLDMVQVDRWFHWWPLLLFALALGKFLDRGIVWSSGGNFLLWGGILGMLWEMGREDLVYRWWPLNLIYLGLIYIARSYVPRPAQGRRPDILNEPSETKP